MEVAPRGNKLFDKVALGLVVAKNHNKDSVCASHCPQHDDNYAERFSGTVLRKRIFHSGGSGPKLGQRDYMIDSLARLDFFCSMLKSNCGRSLEI